MFEPRQGSALHFLHLSMLDLKLFRAAQGGEPNLVRESQRRRRADVKLVDRVVLLDEQWRAAQRQLQQLQRTKAAEHRKRAEAARAAVVPGGAAADVGATESVSSDASAPPNRSELTRQLQDAEVDERARQQELTAALLSIGALVHEDAPVGRELERVEGTKESADQRDAIDPTRRAGVAIESPSKRDAVDNVQWQVCGQGVLSQQQSMLSHAVAAVSKAGYELLQIPLRPPPARAEQLAKVCQSRGELPCDSTIGALPSELRAELERDPIAALHAGDWLQPNTLPVRYACVVRSPVGGEGGGEGDVEADIEGGLQGVEELWVHELWPDDGSAWEALGDLTQLVEEIHESFGLHPSRAEVPTELLGKREARAFVLLTSDGRGGQIELARASSAADFWARRLGIRCGVKQLNERSKRFVYSLSACVCRPPRALPASAIPRDEGAASSHGAPRVSDSLPGPLASLSLHDTRKPRASARRFLRNVAGSGRRSTGSPNTHPGRRSMGSPNTGRRSTGLPNTVVARLRSLLPGMDVAGSGRRSTGSPNTGRRSMGSPNTGRRSTGLPNTVVARLRSLLPGRNVAGSGRRSPESPYMFAASPATVPQSLAGQVEAV